MPVWQLPGEGNCHAVTSHEPQSHPPATAPSARATTSSPTLPAPFGGAAALSARPRHPQRSRV